MGLSSRWIPVFALLLPGLPAGVAGQSPTPFCFTPRPLAECRTFAVSEVVLGGRLLGSDPPDPQYIDQMMEWRVVTELGLMVNRGPTSAIGGSAVARIGDEIIVWGPRARYRRWLPNGNAWELAAALLVASSEPPAEGWGGFGPASYDGLGLEVGGAFMPAQWTALGADVVAMPFAGGGWDWSLQPSLRLTGPVGLIIGVAFGMVAATKPSMSW